MNYLNMLLFSCMGTSSTATTATETTESGSSWWVIVIYVVIFAAFIYFIMIRPSKKQKKEQEQTYSSMQAGDSVLTTSGFYGTIVSVNGDTVIVEFGNNKNCRIPMAKQAISQVEKAGAATSADAAPKQKFFRKKAEEQVEEQKPEETQETSECSGSCSESSSSDEASK